MSGMLIRRCVCVCVELSEYTVHTHLVLTVPVGYGMAPRPGHDMMPSQPSVRVCTQYCT